MAKRKATAVRAARLGAQAFARISAEERRRVVAAETARMKRQQEDERATRTRERQRTEEFEARQTEREFQRGITTRREERDIAGPRITPFQERSLAIRERGEERGRRQEQIGFKRQAVDDARRQILSTYTNPFDAQEALTALYEKSGTYTPEVAKAQRTSNAKARVEHDQKEIEQRQGQEAAILEEIGRARTAEEGMRIFEANEQVLSPQARQRAMAGLMERAAQQVEAARFAWEKHPAYQDLSIRAKQLFIESVPPEGGPQTAVEVLKLARAAVKAERAERQEVRVQTEKAKKKAVAAPTKSQREEIAALKSMFRRNMVPDEDGEPEPLQEGEDPQLAFLAAIERAKLDPLHFADILGPVGGAPTGAPQTRPGFVLMRDPQGRPMQVPQENVAAAEAAGWSR